MIVWLNGRFVPEEEAVVSVFDRSFLYGDGLFEGIRLYGGKPFRWGAHWQRLQSAAEGLRISVPFEEGRARLACSELWEKNERPPDAVVRMVLSRGVGLRGYSPRGAVQPTFVMSLHPLPPLGPAVPFALITASVVVAAGDRLALYKSCNKLHQVLARMEADDAEAQEALLVNTNGYVTETSSGNVFWVNNGTVFTTPLSASALPGITRQVVTELCRELNLRFAEAEITPRELRAVDSIFVTMSTQEIVEVTQFDGQPSTRSELVAKLREAYRAIVTKELK